MSKKSIKEAIVADLPTEPPVEPPEPSDEPEPVRLSRLPSQFDIADQLVEFIHETWPQAKMQDWVTFYNALGLARNRLRLSWTKRKREQQERGQPV